MARKVFVIEWDDELGKEWMNEYNLLSLCHSPISTNQTLKITDVTQELSDAKKSLRKVTYGKTPENILFVHAMLGGVLGKEIV